MPNRRANRAPKTPPAADEPGAAASGASFPTFPVVGVGASAGGLEAFTQLLNALPADPGMAFVLIPHLAPTHRSALAEILARSSKMPVTEAREGSPVEPNHVYVIPPNRCMGIGGGALQLSPREKAGNQRVIDHFFRALAEDRQYQAIGVVLSGTASDGTLGLEAIKGEGGITFAQDDSAQQDGMPLSAIASGCVDFVLPPDEIARELTRIGRHPSVILTKDAPEPDSRPSLAPVVQQLRRATGVDFTHYKYNTFYRRITRRMILHKIEQLGEYLKLLRQTPAEVDALYQDVLINVTSFFRNPNAFEVLKTKVFPRLIEQRSRHEPPVRMWTLGCSTGQEAYSLVMAYMEFAEGQGSDAPLQLFATDLSAASIDKARAGVYSKDSVQDVSPERLRRFFVEASGNYRINQTVRDACVFSRHNVLTDPPFSRMDLISCRNLLIYLEPVLQQEILPTLHYALKPDGCLWLGSSETIGSFRDLFEAQDAKHKIYAKKTGAGVANAPYSRKFPLQQRGAPRPEFIPIAARPRDAVADLHKEAERFLLNKFAPPGVLVSADLDILQYRGDTGAYLAPAPGKASLNLLRMLREGLLVGVRAAILRADKGGAPVREEGLRVKAKGGYREVAVEVIPIKHPAAQQRGFLVLFEQAGAVSETTPEQESPALVEPQGAGADNARLARELSATRECMQSVIEQQEAANEELQSAIEEVQSANEELQSTNEELETSKEEIQSGSEEVATVNDELNIRNTELNRSNNDLANLLDSVNMAIVMLGPDLRVRRFTPAAEKLLNLISTDAGRPLADFRLNLDPLPDLQSLLTQVLDTVSARECEVRDRHGHWYSLRLRPYRTPEHKIDGVVMVLVDVDLLKRAQEYRESIVATVREPLVVLDADLHVRTASESFYRSFGVAREQTEGRLLYELGNGQWNIPELRRLLEQVLPGNNQFNDYEVQHEFEDIGKKTMLLNARPLLQPGERTPSILLAIEDITGRKAAEEATARLAAIVASSEDAIISKDLDGVIISWNQGAEHLFGYSAGEVIGKPVTLLIPENHADEEPRILEQIRRGEAVVHYETVRRRKDGSLVDISLTVSPLRDGAGRIVGASKIARDITERKGAEEALRENHARLQAHAEELNRFNHVAVGRELRMIELKHEINELCQRHGEAARFPLEFEQKAKDSDGDTTSSRRNVS